MLDSINEFWTKIYEMANYKKDAIDCINEKLPEIIEHLLKLFLCKDRDNEVKWQNEVLTWLKEINRKCRRLKNGKPLSYDEMVKNLKLDLPDSKSISEYISSVDDDWRIHPLNKGMSPMPKVEYDINELYNDIYSLLDRQFSAISSKQWSVTNLVTDKVYVKHLNNFKEVK